MNAPSSTRRSLVVAAAILGAAAGTPAAGAGDTSAYSPAPSATTGAVTPSVAGTYYISPSGNDANSCATAQAISTPKQTIQSGLTCLTAGSTLILRDGTYSGIANAFQNLPNGTVGNYVTIKAENEGSVIITGDLATTHTNQYLVVQGLRFQSPTKVILGNHLKFFRNEFRGGCSSGNCVNTQVGSNDFADTADILLEDSWFHGYPGGRYTLGSSAF